MSVVVYRTLALPEPEPPDPDVDAYGRRAAADRRRLAVVVVVVAVLLVLTVLAFALRRIMQERELVLRWREVLACLDDGSGGLERRVRARQLLAIGDLAEGGTTWPSGCEGPLRALADASEDLDHPVLASSARDLARLVGRDDPDAEDVVPPTSRLFDDAAAVGLRPKPSANARGTQRSLPLLSELSALPSMPTPRAVADVLACAVDDEGRSLACAVDRTRSALQESHTRTFAVARNVDLLTRRGPRAADGSVGVSRLVTLDAENLGVWSCDAQGACRVEDAGIGPRPSLLAVGHVGTKVVLVWAQPGVVGGIRMRLAERGTLGEGRTRVVADERAPGIGAVSGIDLIEGPTYALIVLRTTTESTFVLRLDASGELSNVMGSYVQSFSR